MTATDDSDRLYIFNPASGDWRNRPQPCWRRTAITRWRSDDDGSLYVMGGRSTNIVERINTQASSQAPLAVGRQFTTAEDQASRSTWSPMTATETVNRLVVTSSTPTAPRKFVINPTGR